MAYSPNHNTLKYSYLLDPKLLKFLLGPNYSDGLSIKVDCLYEKSFPKSEKIEDYMESSGTGFAFSRYGFVITNYHVIKDAKLIRIKGINGDMTKGYEAHLQEGDEENDIALLKIDFENIDLGQIPYNLNTKEADVGRDIFVLGYPLLATMGTEIKLTNGIISSQSGFLGSKNTYQISAPVQPGNSGAPVFDRKGNLIGVISSRHKDAQNVSYAIKTENLILPIASLNLLKEETPKGKELAGLSLPAQVKKLKKYIYLIEVY